MATHGIIFDIKKFAIHDGPGIRTTVFFKGCPLDCWWCQNPEGRKIEPETIYVQGFRPGNELFGREISIQNLMSEIEKDRIFYEQSGGGVTFSGGEPMLQIDFLESILLECKKNGISTAVDTCGYVPFEDFERILNLVNLFLYDIKIIDDTRHREFTGVSNNLILENLIRLEDKNVSIIARIPLIPGYTDNMNNLKAIARFLAKLKNIKNVSLLPYNRLGEDKRRRFGLENKVGRLNSQSEGIIVSIRKFFEDSGFEVKVGG